MRKIILLIIICCSCDTGTKDERFTRFHIQGATYLVTDQKTGCLWIVDEKDIQKKECPCDTVTIIQIPDQRVDTIKITQSGSDK